MSREKNPHIEFPPMPTIIPGPPDKGVDEALRTAAGIRCPSEALDAKKEPALTPSKEEKHETQTTGAGSFRNYPTRFSQNAPAPPPRASRRPFPGYQGLQPHRLRQNPEEERFARAWAQENRDGRTLTYILCDGHEQHRPPTPSARDFDVAATVVQWLGSPVGQTFLRDLGYKGPDELASPAKKFPRGHDTDDGPCECGAWHSPGEVLK